MDPMRGFKMHLGGPNFFCFGGRGGVEIFFDICVFPPCTLYIPNRLVFNGAPNALVKFSGLLNLAQ
jgi:hypothetical protein